MSPPLPRPRRGGTPRAPRNEPTSPATPSRGRSPRSGRRGTPRASHRRSATGHPVTTRTPTTPTIPKKCFPSEPGSKPGSVPASVASGGGWSFLYADRYRAAPATYSEPGGGEGAPAGEPAVPLWSCSRWGLPCPPCHHGGGALLPHRFTLTRVATGGLFSVALSFESPRLAVSQHHALGARTFLGGRPLRGVRRDHPPSSGGKRRQYTPRPPTQGQRYLMTVPRT
jgi:hypothetical protein